MEVELIALRSIRVEVTLFGAPVLEFSTLLEVTEAGKYTSMRVVQDLLGVSPLFWVFSGDNGV